MEIIARLLAAADRGDPGAVETALSEGADIEGRDPEGYTALLIACRGGHHAVVELLLQHQASVAARDPKGETPLIIAARRDEAPIAGALISAGAGLDDVDAEGWTPLLWAIGKGNLPLVRALVEAGADVTRQGESSPLLGAVTCASLVSPVICFVRGRSMAEEVSTRLAIATLLLDAGADPDGRQPSDGRTVLMTAAAAGLDGLVVRLLAAGADVALADKEGKTALDHLHPYKGDPVQMADRLRAAVKNRTPGVPARPPAARPERGSPEARRRAVERLEQAPHTPEQAQPEPPPTTPVDTYELFAAVRYGDTKRVRRLLAAGAPVDARDDGGQTPLLAAASSKRLGTSRLLIQLGADVDASDQNGETAMYWAAREMPALRKAIRAAPADALTRSRRLLEEASGARSALAPNLREEARAFAEAARGGQDLDRHLPVLLHCYESLGRDPEIQGILARPLVLHALRTGDRALLARLARAAGGDGPTGGRLRELAQEGLRIALAFADSCGAELRPVYDIVVSLVAAARGVEPLPEHLGRHPERLGELAELMLQQAPGALPRLMLRLRAMGWKGDASPGARALVSLLRSSDDELVVAAEQALAPLARARALDLAPALGDLDELVVDGKHGFLASALSVQSALAQEPVAWGALDRFCGHELEEARRGAIQGLAWAWLRDQRASQITSRLAAGLLDPAAEVRRLASESLALGRRHEQPFSEVDPATLARLVAALGSPEESDAVGDFLEEYVRSERRRRAADVLALLPQSAALGDRAEQLARIAREVVEERHSAPCSICRYLTADLRWGDAGPGGKAVEAPPELRRLEPLPEKAYRCPECGTFYDLKEVTDDWMNYDWTTYWLERRPASDAQAVWARTQEYLRRQDLAGLDRVLLHDPAPDVRLRAMATLEGHVEQGLDVSPLEPTLRRLLEEPSDTNAAARLLARHLLRRGRAPEVEPLLRRAALETRKGAVDAVWKAATGRWADVRPCLAAVRAFLAEDDDRTRWNAVAILASAGLQGTEARKTVAGAIEHLARGRDPREHAAAASLLADAARVASISGALPRLGELLGDPNARDAITRAAARGADIGALVPALVGRLRSGSHDVVGILVGLQERGGDISSAFDVLASIGGGGPLEALKRAGAKGDDLTPAIAALHEVVEKANRLPEDAAASTSEGYHGETAAQALTSHYAFRGRWEDLARLVHGGCGRVRGGCARALLELAGAAPCDLTGAVPILREIADSENKAVRWAAEAALSRISEGHPGRKR